MIEAAGRVCRESGPESASVGFAAALAGTSAAAKPAESKPSAGGTRTALAVRGGAWTIIEYAATQLLRTIAMLVLARHFLSPEAFGVVGLAMVFISGLSMFSELGLVVNIVQHPRGDDPEFLNTAFTIQATRGLIIWTGAAVAAYPVARFYQQPELFLLLVVAGSAELVRGLTSTAAWTLKRHLNLRKIALLGITSEGVAFLVGIVWAIMSPSAWALVARSLASAAVFAAGSYFVTTYPVRFRWNQSVAKDILRFGGWISLSTAAFFLAGQGERLILGKFMSAAELGCFSLAVAIAAAPAGAVSQLASQIFLPMISRSVRVSRVETFHDFRRGRQIFFCVAVIAAMGFLIFAKPFVALVLNPRYQMTGWMLQLLGLRVAMDLFAAPASSLILAHGQSRYTAAGNTIRLVFMVGGIWLAFTRFGTYAAILALIIAQAVSYLPLIIGLRRLLPEAGHTELRWYAALLLLLTVAAVLIPAASV